MSVDFLRALWTPAAGYGELRAIKDGKVSQSFYSLGVDSEYDEAARDAVDYNRGDWDVYFGILRRTREGGKASDVVDHAPVLWADVDPYKTAENPMTTSEQIQEYGLFRVLSFSISPSIIVSSGHGYHAYWLLRDAAPIGDATLAMKGIAKAIGGDHTYDAARVLRLPGTHNHKDVASGGAKVPVRLLRLDTTRRYRFSDFSDYMDSGGGRGTPAGWAYHTHVGMYAAGQIEPAVRMPRKREGAPEWLNELVLHGVERGRRSEQCFKAMVWLLRFGHTHPEIYDIFRANPKGIGAKMDELSLIKGDRWFEITMRAAQEAV